MIHRGGTILEDVAHEPGELEDGLVRVRRTLARERIDVLVVIGGEDTLRWPRRSPPTASSSGVRSIDNDLSATDVTFGFQDRGADRHRRDRPSRTTAESTTG